MKAKKEKLDADEKSFLDAIRKADRAGKLKRLPASEAKKYGDWARAQLKTERITLRVSGPDLEAVKSLAAKQGKKYQTLLGEMIHQMATKAA